MATFGELAQVATFLAVAVAVRYLRSLWRLQVQINEALSKRLAQIEGEREAEAIRIFP